MSTKSSPPLFVRQDLGFGRPIVLLHGMFGDGTQWRVMAGLLAETYRVIVVDLLGHGQSTRPDGAEYTPREHSLALRETLESLGATEDATIVGYSMGGTVALQYAADYHDVAQLYMISTPFYLKPEEMVSSDYANSLVYTKFSTTLYRWVDRSLEPGKLLNKLVQRDQPLRLLHYLIDAYDNELDPEITRRNLDHLIYDFPFVANLAKVTAPITFFTGKHDLFVVHGQLLALKRIQPYMEIQSLGIVKNDHMVVQYLPKKLVGVLTRYELQELHIATDQGSGDVLILLHGIESASSYWSNIIPNLAAKYRVIAIDLLGFGESPAPLNIAYSLDDQVKWLRWTLAAKGLHSVNLMGHSLGALVALAYAAAYPDEAKSLTMISPVFFDPDTSSERYLIRKLKFAHLFAETSYLVSTVTRAIGSEKLRPYIPTIRSTESAVKHQQSLALAKLARKVPATIVYGERDSLVDQAQLRAVSAQFADVHVEPVKGSYHNFATSDPSKLLEAIELESSPTPEPKQSSVKYHNFFREIVKLALPILLTKGIFYLAVGALLLSQYRAETLVLAVALLVIIQAVQFIKGSFSLKNEGISYLGYLSIGVGTAIFGYLLLRRFEVTLLIAVVATCAYITLNGITRLMAGYLWTTRQPLRRRQIALGWVLTIIGLTALLGSTFSARAIVYAIVAVAFVRGVTYIAYGLMTVAFAYVRGHK